MALWIWERREIGHDYVNIFVNGWPKIGNTWEGLGQEDYVINFTLDILILISLETSV